MRNPVQNIYIKKVEKKKMFGYDKDRALEHRHQDLPERQPVRTVQEGRVPGDAGLQPRLSAL